MKKVKEWLKNRRVQYFLYAVPCGAISILFALGMSIGAGFRGFECNRLWDWADWSCTVLGGMIGQIGTILLLSL